MTSWPCKKDFIHHMHLSVWRHSTPTAGFSVGKEEEEEEEEEGEEEEEEEEEKEEEEEDLW